MSAEERDWLEEKYPGWNDTFGKQWDVITKNVRAGKIEATLPETLPVICNMCQIPVVSPMGYLVGHLSSPDPRIVMHNGRKYTFCGEICQWVFQQQPERFQGHTTLVDRFLAGEIQPPTLEGVLAYMSLSPDEMGQDATNHAWARQAVPLPVAGS